MAAIFGHLLTRMLDPVYSHPADIALYSLAAVAMMFPAKRIFRAAKGAPLTVSFQLVAPYVLSLIICLLLLTGAVINTFQSSAESF
jgi:hypothetical protein